MWYAPPQVRTALEPRLDQWRVRDVPHARCACCIRASVLSTRRAHLARAPVQLTCHKQLLCAPVLSLSSAADQDKDRHLQLSYAPYGPQLQRRRICCDGPRTATAMLHQSILFSASAPRFSQPKYGSTREKSTSVKPDKDPRPSHQACGEHPFARLCPSTFTKPPDPTASSLRLY
jgi:hypothetical protein